MLLDGILIKTPTKLKPSSFLISKAERNAVGDMVIDIIAIKRRLDLEWAYIKDVEISLIMNILDSKALYTVTYPDPQYGENHTITVYRGDVGTETGQRIKGTRYWEGVSLALIER